MLVRINTRWCWTLARPPPESYNYNHISGYCKFVRTDRLWLSGDRPGGREREREREDKNPLSVGLQCGRVWAEAKPGKPDKYNVPADCWSDLHFLWSNVSWQYEMILLRRLQTTNLVVWSHGGGGAGGTDRVQNTSTPDLVGCHGWPDMLDHVSMVLNERNSVARGGTRWYTVIWCLWCSEHC